MDYTKLTYFFAAAKHCHVTRASEELHIAQPALTKAIHTLEEEIGVKLFFRRGRGIALTPAGTFLKGRAEEIIARMGRLEEEMQVFSGQEQNTVRLSVRAASTYVTRAVVDFRRENADVRFKLMQNDQDTDCHITVATAHPAQVVPEASEAYRIYQEPILLAVPRHSPYGTRTAIALRDVKEEAFVSLAGSKALRSICDAFCREAGFVPKTTFESDSLLSVRNFIDAELGVGFWPAFTWETAQIDGIVHLPITEPQCARLLTVCLHEERAPTPAAKRFFAFLTRRLDQA